MSTRREVLQQKLANVEAELELFDTIDRVVELLRQLQLHHNSMARGSTVTMKYNEQLAAKCWGAQDELRRWAR